MDAKSQLKRVTRDIAEALSPDTDAGTDILKTLKKEHNEVKSLLNELVESAEDARQRKALVQKIKQALVPHTKAEEKVVYDAIIALRDKEAKINGHEGYVEHELAGRTLKRLDALTDASSPEHKATAKVLRELVEHHIKEEESNVWGDVKDNFTPEERERMNVAFEKAKAQVKVP
jgi:hemerythrin superfamily protein